MASLKGKTAFISGGSRGIGLAIASRLARDGADVTISGSNPSHVEAAIATISQTAAGRVAGHASDLRTLEGCQSVFDAHGNAFGSCDILVHSAGATKGGSSMRSQVTASTSR